VVSVVKTCCRFGNRRPVCDCKASKSTDQRDLTPKNGSTWYGPPPPAIRESGNVDRFLLSLLILNWREHIERAVPSLAIVKDLELFEKLAGELDSGFPLSSV
jgi:hypothetical protein